MQRVARSSAAPAAGASETQPETIARCAAVLDEVLGRRLHGIRRYAIVGSEVVNIGDAAIQVAQRAWLEAHGFPPPVARMDRRTYDARALASALGPEGAILLSGGGNLGDLWPRFEDLRRRVLADFPGRRIVQLPQTLCFSSAAACLEAGRAYGRCPRFVLLVRDPRGLEDAGRLGVEAEECPDVAFALGALARPATPTRRVLWHLRVDQESARRRPDRSLVPVEGVEPEDWPVPRRGIARVLRRAIGRGLGVAPGGAWWRRRAHEALVASSAAHRTAEGLRHLSQAEAVVTDRLHGHLLCLLLGIPHVVLAEANGKNARFVARWTAACSLVRTASTPGEARALLEASP